MLMQPFPIISKTGDIDWRASVYKVTFIEGEPARLEHKPTSQIVNIENDYRVTSAWSTRNNFDDMGAQLWRTKAQKFFCKDFFAPGTGPFGVLQVKGAGDVLEKYADEAVQELKSGLSGIALEQAKVEFKAPIAKARAEGTKRAREALLAKSAAQDARRRAKLS